MQDRLTGDSDSPLNVDHQNKVFGGGFKPKKVEGFMTAVPSALPGGCRRSEGTSVRRERTAKRLLPSKAEALVKANYGVINDDKISINN